jgi:hypothetical protein
MVKGTDRGKEWYYYLDSTPTHPDMKALHKYPQHRRKHAR